MNFLSLARYAVGVSAAAAMLASCNGSQSSGTTAPGLPQQNAAISHQGVHGLPSLRIQKMMNAMGLPMRLPTHSGKNKKSWMSPLAKNTQYLLYVSNDSTGQVDVFNYRTMGKLYGQLSGFSLAGGQCSDTAGNVYIIDLGLGTLTEFAHGSATPTGSATITDFDEPFSCSVDPTTGNIALPTFGDSLVDIFVGGITGTQEQVSTLEPYSEGVGYDPSGNLFQTIGTSGSGGTELVECPATCESGSSFSVVPMPAAATCPGGTQVICFLSSVMWDGTYLAVGDQQYNYPALSYDEGIYRVNSTTGAIFSSAGYAASPSSPQTDAQQFWTTGTTKALNRVLFANLVTLQEGYWNKNTGGSPIKVLTGTNAPEGFYGNTVSAAPKVGS
jgi:hypothetical protein